MARSHAAYDLHRAQEAIGTSLCKFRDRAIENELLQIKRRLGQIEKELRENPYS